MGRSSLTDTADNSFRTIVLLSGEIEQCNLALILKKFNPKLKVAPVGTATQLAALSPALLARARLLAFSTPVVVPAPILHQLGYGAYNFHPGSPDYPGWYPVSFAHYDRAPVFGATAHIMVEQVDAGPIVDLELFEVEPGTTAEQLGEAAYAAAVRIFWRLAEPLATRPEPLPTLPIRWGGPKTSRRTFARQCEISPDMPAEELARRVAAFGLGDGTSVPTVTLHGFRFRLVRE
jgi:methionyl-tRNA formyltransferase